jgi:hypothetical protein
MTRIVDIHSNLWPEDWLPERFWETFVEIAIRKKTRRREDGQPRFYP